MYRGMHLTIWDVEHGACAMLAPFDPQGIGRLAMIDSGHASDWRPSRYIQANLGRNHLDYLFITNADQDHMSDLEGIWNAGIGVGALYRNPHPPPADLRRIKLQSGPLSSDIERFLSIHEGYVYPVTEPFDQYMRGIEARVYYNPYPQFTDTNNLSMVVFVEYAGFKIAFPGDLERDGWLALLENPLFRAELLTTKVLVASHHGRQSGYCPEVFDFCFPEVVVMSDKAIVHDTQLMAGAYRRQVQRTNPNGVTVSNTGESRHVLTTRSDGHINIAVCDDGTYRFSTERGG